MSEDNESDEVALARFRLLATGPWRFRVKQWVDRHKPAAGVDTHLMLAWLIWATVGSGLVGVGARWTWEEEPGMALLIAAIAVAVGIVKSRFVLDRAARSLVDRIHVRGDGRCLGGFLSPGTWGLVILMMAVGRLLRGTLAHGIVGPLYIAVGAALCISSRISWRAWRESRRTH